MIDVEVEPYHSDLRVVFEDPNMPDDAAKVLIPDPTFMAIAMKGYLGFGTLTEEQAIEYIIMKDVPKHIWDGSIKSNRTFLQIIKTSQLPSTRVWRNAWRIKQ